MSLRTRLFLLFGGLLALLMAAQWWWVRTLSQDLSDEAGFMAVEVSNRVATLLSEVEGNVETSVHEVHRDVEVIHLQPEDANPDRIHPQKTIVLKTYRNESPEDSTLPSDAEAGPAQQDNEVDLRQIVKRLELGSGDSEADAFGEIGQEASYTYRFELDADLTEDQSFHRIFRLGGEDHPTMLSLVASGAQLESFPIPNQGFRSRLDDFSQRWLLGTLTLLIVGLLLAALVAHRVSAPLRHLAEGARQLGDGQLGAQVPATSGGEVGEAMAAFNQMSTRLEQLDRETRQLQAREHLGEIGEIARGLAHSLRNPLNALGLSVEELATEKPDHQALAETARRQIRRIDRSLRSFLALSSGPTGGASIASEIDLGSLVQDVALEALQDGAQKILIDVEVAENVPPLFGIEAEIRAVLQALLVNAADASPEGESVQLHLVYDETEGHRIDIADRGPGLPEAVRERLFTPHLTTKAHGSGMGLFLAHRITTNRYSGSLTLQDRADGGTLAQLNLRSRIEEANHA